MSASDTVTYELDPERPPTARQKAALDALAALPDEEIDTSDIPPLPERFWQNATRNPFWLTVLRRDIETGLTQLDRGEGGPVEEVFDRLRKQHADGP